MRKSSLLLAAACALPMTACGAFAQNPPPFGGTQNTYLCHNINNARALAYKAAAEDQFGETEFEILEATKICNPLRGKFQNSATGDEGEFLLADPDIHYICYNIRVAATTALGKDFEVENQLESQKYTSDQPVELCVPTVKRH